MKKGFTRRSYNIKERVMPRTPSGRRRGLSKRSFGKRKFCPTCGQGVPEETLSEHGKHSQKSHGRGGGRKSTSKSAAKTPGEAASRFRAALGGAKGDKRVGNSYVFGRPKKLAAVASVLSDIGFKPTKVSRVYKHSGSFQAVAGRPVNAAADAVSRVDFS